MKSRPPITSRNRFQGIVVPNDWDSDGNVIGITLHTHDEKIYVIEPSRVGNELLKHVRQRVRVHGKVRQRLDGSTLIRVINFEVFTGLTEQVKKTA